MSGYDSAAEDMWARHSAEWRDTAQVCSQWREASSVDAKLLEAKASKGWWDLLERLGVTLLITREYEHLAIAASVQNGHPRMSYFPVPHPSGLAVDRTGGRVFLASTRNPNQVFTFKPSSAGVERGDRKPASFKGAPLTAVSSAFYPGSLYLHDLAVVGAGLYGNAVGHNAVVRLNSDGTFRREWWPRCIEQNGQPVFSSNYIQLNSIAAGTTLKHSYFSASSSSIGRRRPGHLDYPVDGRGVIFSGATREPICTGLTRPHSARLSDGRVWVANSGYGELGVVENGRLQTIAQLPGWTRGLCLVGDTAFVATSRVIPKFARYAPGLDVQASRCALHAISCKSGAVLARLDWPYGNQVFAIDWIGAGVSAGFPFDARQRRFDGAADLYYSYLTD
jgi:uncharacterized protein (TIGR03032 family)